MNNKEITEIYKKGNYSGYEWCYKVKNNKEIIITEKEYKKIKLKNKKLEKIDYIKRNRFTRFEIMEI